MLTSFLNEYRSLPVSDASNRVVSWHVFRTISEAEEYAESIRLGDGQRIVGGMDADSVGKLWWVGVEVDDIACWGNPAAVNKHAE
ncbi:hypothetical protein TPL01_22950 [Sulfuriferula plumbiphila]|uniref:Uncharacterized protein n=1 Tax=Sulfuriferula plumbiphila TaxID=171865 RepID=A0A512L9M6_9PROT|nr:hypothetical protein [Sulfuriferula plumbiphila]BBP06004.1 hypothetical protein SFPGR_34260 [Sulfuriferula plumbiphila]GEP31157.1 hypothetical protein TPL01_22950 [Sulfuriferula plumbiphila]